VTGSHVDRKTKREALTTKTTKTTNKDRQKQSSLFFVAFLSSW